mmetsp:Transcript_62106/g.109362  ORF Transcript_62106/g.109362 Transcript_62106/m.109362 type:complete len:235 (-) Transcript_62106:119-823(-)
MKQSSRGGRCGEKLRDLLDGSGLGGGGHSRGARRHPRVTAGLLRHGLDRAGVDTGQKLSVEGSGLVAFHHCLGQGQHKAGGILHRVFGAHLRKQSAKVLLCVWSRGDAIEDQSEAHGVLLLHQHIDLHQHVRTRLSQRVHDEDQCVQIATQCGQRPSGLQEGAQTAGQVPIRGVLLEVVEEAHHVLAAFAHINAHLLLRHTLALSRRTDIGRNAGHLGLDKLRQVQCSQLACHR